MSKAIVLSSVTVDPMIVAPFTHQLTLVSGGWTHVSNLELPHIELVITAHSLRRSALECRTRAGHATEPFDYTLDDFAGAIGVLVPWLQAHEPIAARHLLQGVASALVYFGRQYGLITLDEDDTVTAHARRQYEH